MSWILSVSISTWDWGGGREETQAVSPCDTHTRHFVCAEFWGLLGSEKGRHPCLTLNLTFMGRLGWEAGRSSGPQTKELVPVSPGQRDLPPCAALG